MDQNFIFQIWRWNFRKIHDRIIASAKEHRGKNSFIMNVQWT